MSVKNSIGDFIRPARVKRMVLELAMATHVVAAQNDFTRFIVLGRGRSGSNFLTTSLADHPNIMAFGEIFNNQARDNGTVNFSYPGYNGNLQKHVATRNDAPVEFLDSTIFAKQPRAIQAVGFKLFYYHAQEADWKAVWPHLTAQKVRAIHLRRDNLLASLVSEQIAQRTNVWSTNTTKTAADDHPSTIAIDAATCLEYFETVNRLQTSHRDFFSQTLDVVYEDLLKNYEGEMDRVQRFLGVPVRTLRSPLKKQSKSPLNVTLSNFSELETKFRNTPWSRYFEMQT